MVYSSLLQSQKSGRKQFAVLIDPENVDHNTLFDLIDLANQAEVDFILVGGSLVTTPLLDEYIKVIRASSNIPVVLFPGSPLQISNEADAILMLSLISGRNAELLIGHHVTAAPRLKASPLEVISTGYLLIDGGRPTSASYMSNTNPIPSDKDDIAVATAMAGEMLGLQSIYMDSGSGALQPIREEMVNKVSSNIDVPLWIGGGIKTPEEAAKVAKAGADVVVVGNAIEKEVTLLSELADSVKTVSNGVIDSFKSR